MGFADQARKILEYNRGLLRENDFFNELGASTKKSNPSKIDIRKLKQNAIKRIRIKKDVIFLEK